MRALVVRQDNNGDVILAGPAIRTISERFDRVSLLVSPSGAGAASLLPGVDDVIVERTEWIDANPQPVDRASIDALIARIRSSAIDDAFVLTSWHQSPLPTALVLRLAGVSRIHAISEDYPGALLDTRAIVPNDIHEVERNLRLLAAAGIAAPEDDRLVLYGLPPREAALPDSYVVVQPGASVPARAWSPKANQALVAALASRGDAVVVTGSRSERALVEDVAGIYAIAAYDRSFAEYAAIVRDARAIVVGNTSGAHVAAAVGTPVVSLFAPTIPAVRFRPWRVPHVLLGDQRIACAGCRARRCPIEGQPCIGGVDVVDVIAALDSLVSRSLVGAG